MSRHATAEDFTRWETTAKAMTAAELHWSVRDALAASHAVDSHDPIAGGRYRDEACTYQSEINTRSGR